MSEFETIKRQWEVRNLTSGEIAWLIKEVEELKKINMMIGTNNVIMNDNQKEIDNILTTKFKPIYLGNEPKGMFIAQKEFINLLELMR